MDIKVGDKLYIESEGYIGHGEDDIAGGLATVSEVDDWYICFEEVGKHSRYNKVYILNNQEEWSKRYNSQIAHHDPDYTDYGERW
jgi:hypothetical protein